jgi:hypothetical protein
LSNYNFAILSRSSWYIRWLKYQGKLQHMHISVNHQSIVTWLLSICLSLLVVHILFQFLRWELGWEGYHNLFARFDLDNEVSVPTWYSQLLFLGASILLFLIAQQLRLENAKFVRHWIILSCIFLYLSIDDGAMIHEGFNEPIRIVLTQLGMTNIIDNAWLYGAALIVVPLGLSYLRFLWSLDYVTRWRFIVAGLVFVMGAVGFEVISSGYGGFEYKMVIAIEEFLEMVGVVLFIRALFLYMARRMPRELVFHMSEYEK